MEDGRAWIILRGHQLRGRRQPYVGETIEASVVDMEHRRLPDGQHPRLKIFLPNSANPITIPQNRWSLFPFSLVNQPSAIHLGEMYRSLRSRVTIGDSDLLSQWGRKGTCTDWLNVINRWRCTPVTLISRSRTGTVIAGLSRPMECVDLTP